MRRLFWILLLIFVGYCMAAAAFQEVRDATYYVGVTVIGEPTALAVGDFWASIVADPTYQAWHWAIWFIGGVVALFATQHLLSKRPTWLWNKAKIVTTTYQNQPVAQPPVQLQQQPAPVTVTAPTVQVSPPTVTVQEKPKEA